MPLYSWKSTWGLFLSASKLFHLRAVPGKKVLRRWNRT